MLIAVRFDVEAAAADRWSDRLLEAGALSVDAADPRAGTADEAAVFDEPGVPGERWWPVARLTSLLAPGTDTKAFLHRAAALADEPVPAYETFPVADRDWVRATQAQFVPLRIEDNLWIVPTWCTPPNPAAVNVMLDPGVAFGTGSHPTTRLCLAWLRQRVKPGCSVLDYGCGSGILAIAAARLGAARVTGVDIDPQALHASAENAAQNGVDVTFVHADALPHGRFDIVIGNILANPLRLLAPALTAHTQRGGSIALAGILAAQVADVCAAYANSFDVAAWREEDGWVLLAGRRNPA
ncbi:MAG TPA: 50S ribosomal protein L11 methyltransferase [Casimicrobiaceae bacterium]|nr:50S ribosomal protein L11 methyltransferase [Casimicrobiaceae bacterium]